MSAAGFPFDHLVVVHYHWRPGGVRRVVELTLPAIAGAAAPALKRITVLNGGSIDERPVFENLRTPVAFIHEPACDYFSSQTESPLALSLKIRQALQRAFPQREASRTLIWFQNPALARNPILCREVVNFSRHTGAALVFHHHDFWCAGRWARWEELQQCGCTDLERAGEILFASGTRCAHAGINWQDFQALEQSFPRQAFHLPNPVECLPRAYGADLATAREKVAKALQSDAPLWLYPTRFLRRKNLLEAVLLTRWLRPEAILATTSGRFSQDESGYARDIQEAAARHGWRVRFGLLDQLKEPSVAEILQAAEVVVHTSVQEGFGMTFVETASAGIPLLARAIPSVMPDLRAQGFDFPQIYDEILIPAELFDTKAEAARQALLADSARLALPEAFREMLPISRHEFRRPAGFSRLTRRAQLEVLAHPPEVSWALCGPLNPALEHFFNTRLKSTPWPDQTLQTPSRYAERFLQIASAIPREPVDTSQRACAVQLDIARLALRPESIFPVQLEP